MKGPVQYEEDARRSYVAVAIEVRVGPSNDETGAEADTEVEMMQEIIVLEFESRSPDLVLLVASVTTYVVGTILDPLIFYDLWAELACSSMLAAAYRSG